MGHRGTDMESTDIHRYQYWNYDWASLIDRVGLLFPVLLSILADKFHKSIPCVVVLLRFYSVRKVPTARCHLDYLPGLSLCRPRTRPLASCIDRTANDLHPTLPLWLFCLRRVSDRRVRGQGNANELQPTRPGAPRPYRSIVCNRHYQRLSISLFGRLVGAKSIQSEEPQARQELVSLEKDNKRRPGGR